MAQVIKIKRGGIASLISSTPSLQQGELLLATGSLNGLGATFFVATASNSPSLPYAKIESISNGATLAASLDSNFTGLLIHSASDNKLYRYNGSTFVELPIAAGSFTGILPVVNGGTGQGTLDDIVGDTKIIVSNGEDTVIGGNVTLSLGGGVVSGSAQINGTAIQNNTITIAGTATALGGSISYATITNNTGTVSGSAQVNGTAIANNTITIAGNSTALGSSVTLAQITNGSSIISSSAQIDTLFNIDGLISSSVLSSPSQGTVLLTNNGVDGSNIDLGLQAGDSPSFTGLTLTGLSNQATETTAVVINGTTIGTRELGSNAFTSTTIGTTTNALTDGDGIADFSFDGSSPETIAIDPTQTTITSVKNDSLVIGRTNGNDFIDFATDGNVIIKTNNAPRITVTDAGTTIAGNLTVEGTTTTVDSTIVNISSSIVRVNYGGAAVEGGLEVTDATGTNLATGSLLWDGANSQDWWKAGAKGSEKRVVTFDGNSGGTLNNIQKLDANSYLVDSSLLDNGTTITVASGVDLTLTGTGQLTVSEKVIFNGLTGATNNTSAQVAFVDSSGIVGEIPITVDATATATGFLAYSSDNILEFVSTIDGGTF